MDFVVDNGQGLLSHSYRERGWGAQRVVTMINLKIGLKFSVCAPVTLGLRGVTSRNFFQVTCRNAGMIIWVELLVAALLKFGRAKKRPKLGSLSDNFRLRSRIFPERIKISKIGKKQMIKYKLSHVGRKNGELLPTNNKVLNAHVDPPT